MTTVPRLQIVVLVADDLPLELVATIDASVTRALDKLFVVHGGELSIGYFPATEPPRPIAHTRSYAGPR